MEMILGVLAVVAVLLYRLRGSKNDRLAKRLDACAAGMQDALKTGNVGRFDELDAAADSIDSEAVYDTDRRGHVRDGDPYSCAVDRLTRMRRDYWATVGIRSIEGRVGRGWLNNVLADMRSCLAAGDIDGFNKLDELFKSLGIEARVARGPSALVGARPIHPLAYRGNGAYPTARFGEQLNDCRKAAERFAQLSSGHKKIAVEFAALHSSCGEMWSELSRTLAVRFGTSATQFDDAVDYDVVQILVGFFVASGCGSEPLWSQIGRERWKTLVDFCYAISLSPVLANLALANQQGHPLEGLLRRFLYNSDFWKDCDERLKMVLDDREPTGLPATVTVLSGYEPTMGKAHPAQNNSAFAFCSLVVAVSDQFPGSRPVEILKDKYLALLEPYTNGQFTSQPSSNIGSGGCPECLRYYPVLRLKPDASEKDVKTAYRDRAQIYHPDKVCSSNDRVRKVAEDEMKQLNEAYEHIIEKKHFECVKA